MPSCCGTSVARRVRQPRARVDRHHVRGPQARPARQLPDERGHLRPARSQRVHPIAGKAAVKRNRFVQLSGGTRTVNRELEAKARSLARLKGYVANLRACPDGTQFVKTARRYLLSRARGVPDQRGISGESRSPTGMPHEH
jgi:hypothetical protein